MNKFKELRAFVFLLAIVLSTVSLGLSIAALNLTNILTSLYYLILVYAVMFVIAKQEENKDE